MSMSRREKVEILERRLNYLEGRITEKQYSEGSRGYMRSEIAALRWVLDICYAIIQEIDLRDGELDDGREASISGRKWTDVSL